MNFKISENEQMIADMIKKFADQNIRPDFMKWDEEQHFPVNVFKKLDK